MKKLIGVAISFKKDGLYYGNWFRTYNRSLRTIEVAANIIMKDWKPEIINGGSKFKLKFLYKEPQSGKDLYE